MPRRATKDTFGFEDLGGVEVRRQVMAGQHVPDHYRLEDEDAVEDFEDTRTGYPHEYTVGHGGVEHDYKRPGRSGRGRKGAKIGEEVGVPKEQRVSARVREDAHLGGREDPSAAASRGIVDADRGEEGGSE